MCDTLGQARRIRRNLGCQFVLLAASRFENSKKPAVFGKQLFGLILGLWMTLGASLDQTRQTIIVIKFVYDTLGQVRRNRRNLGCQFVLPTASRFKNSKKSSF